MLSILYPEIMFHLQGFDYGLMPIYLPKEDRFILVIKAPKESILTAKINNEFKIYLIKNPLSPSSYLGLVVAFFDDHDEPLTITTPLFSGDGMLTDVTRLFSQENFDAYFYDENNYELLGTQVYNEEFGRFSKEISAATFPEFQRSEVLSTWQNMGQSFSLRTEEDDINAYKIKLNDRLYPDDVMIIDIRDNFHGFNDQKKNLAVASLERDGDPGSMQEKDIARLLRKVFYGKNIYLNPYQADTKKELSDILIVTDSIMFFVQAKDSPNTEDMLRRSIDRKRKTIRGHIKKATDQMRGTLTYARDHGGVTILLDGKPVTIQLGDRRIAGLVMVKELFDDDYPECSAPVLSLVRELEFPINLLDYPQLHVLTQNLTTPAHFINGLYDALDMALEHEQFPKSVWSGSPH
ncbi:MAG: hypothetical protein IT559_02520 [Alphaproteobacteria bacterium]|nr:hypothetical protein [Alphaproteobacteria bacterium]